MIKNSIRNKLIFWFIIISLIPLIIVGGFGFYNTKSEISNNQLEKIDFFFRNIDSKITKFFISGEKDINLIKDIIEGQLDREDFDRKNLNSIENIYYDFINNNVQYREIALIDANGYEKVKVQRYNGDINIIDENNLKLENDKDYFSEIKDLDKKKIYMWDISLKEEYNSTKTPYNPTVKIAAPIYLENNSRWFVSLDVDVKYILRDIENVRLNNNFDNFMIIDKNGHYILNSFGEKGWGANNNLNTGDNLKEDYPKLYKKILDSNEFNQVNINDNVITWYPVKLKGFDSKFTLLLQVAKRDYSKPLYKFRNVFFLQLFISLIILIFSGILVSRYLSKPILKLVKAVTNISEGSFDISVDIKTKDELQILGKEINNMAMKLKDMYANMEEKVRERTKELRKVKDNLEEIAIKDQLTGLYNRHYFNNYVDSKLKKTCSCNNQCAVFIIDVDDFKDINDNYGHNTGDEVLKVIGGILKSSSRSNDKVIRYGGDEFLVILYNGSEKVAEKYLNRIKSNIDKWNGKTDIIDDYVSVSVGYKVYDCSQDISEVINHADKMMYSNKQKKK
ncbi:sensor domain-containing diguanylate cyclase [Dethiothermospora halolimnae]|uniref:sensor domain-containing diguanylate cyclase n=1 Tax=Dethiothermospora halolimnae TaxID=3114390 RepID=UPI003CCB7EB6